MDYSEYLRQKKLAQTTYIRRQTVMDAGLHTYIKQKAAHSYFVPPTTAAASVTIATTPCCTPAAITSTRVSMKSSEVTPIKQAPGCESSGACAQLADSGTTSYIVLPCRPIDYGTSNTYVNAAVVGGCYTYQSTPAQVKAAATTCCTTATAQ